MKQPRITRRDCAKGMMAAAAGQRAAAATRRYELGNEGLEVSLVLDGGKVVQKTISNRLTGGRFELPGDEFQLEFDSGRILSAKDLSADAAASRGDLDLRYTGSREDPEVRVRYELPQGKRYLRKQISLRWSGERLGLLRADLDNWSGVKGNWASMHADRLRYGSHPIFCDTLWAGVEFPAAFNEYGREGFVLRSRPGGIAIGGEWVELHSTAAGAAEPGRVYEAFLEYIEDIRLAPPRLVACYNSWWTLPKVVRQSDNLALIEDLKAKMYDRFGVFFDIVTTDMGWSNPRTIWQIDRSILPQGFDDIRAIVEPAGAKLGLWMSPSEVYPPVCDYPYLEKQGYVVLWNNRDRRGEKRFAVSLADPKYRNEVKSQLRKLIRENGLGHIKYDGFVAEEPQAHDGLLPGKDSVEPLAAYSLELLKASKQEDPNLVTEPTYMNSLANYISPWILKYSDSVWGNSGGDCPRGIGPAPDYRESHTTAREYFIFSSQREFWLPQNAVHYFDIVHCDEGTGFANHAAMAFGRGRFFLSTYLNPKFMDADDWRIYAGLLQWARKNRDLMRNTVMAASRVELGEPYVYGHWLGMRGVLAVRNPSNETKDFALDLGRAGAPKALADAVCYSQYPYRRGIASGLGGSSVARLRLAPWELLFLEVAPRAGIREPVALGARWYREGNGMSIVADPETETVRLLEPGGGERTVRPGARASAGVRGEMLSETVRKLPESEWLMEKNERQPSSSFDLECSIGVPAGSRGKVLLLVEFPGRRHHENHCSGEVNGRSAAVVERSSAGHIGYAVSSAGNFWKDASAYESEWSWHICEVSAGDSRVRFRGAAAHPSPKLGVWLWTEQDLSGSATHVASSCPEPQMPQYREHLERSGICLKRPRQAL
ncbi:MAG: alpha-galactosidase [Bryobacterales bacterium]|nr:alpha-galactosidase [Bryobacterales bacterium]